MCPPAVVNTQRSHPSSIVCIAHAQAYVVSLVCIGLPRGDSAALWAHWKKRRNLQVCNVTWPKSWGKDECSALVFVKNGGVLV